MGQLAARGQSSTELIHNLFKAYVTVQDQVFVRYIESKENEYDDGNNITPEQLMQVALAKYETRKEAGVWEAPSSEKEEILALKAELVQLRKNNFNNKKKEKPRSNAPNTNNAEGKNKRSKGQYKNKKNRNIKPDWMFVDPSTQEKENGPKKVVKDKTYYWCPKHGCWTRHKPQDCEEKGIKTEDKSTQETVIAPYYDDSDQE